MKKGEEILGVFHCKPNQANNVRYQLELTYTAETRGGRSILSIDCEYFAEGLGLWDWSRLQRSDLQLEGDECLQNAISSDSEATRNCARASLVASHGVVGLVGRTSDGCTYALGVLACGFNLYSAPLKGPSWPASHKFKCISFSHRYAVFLLSSNVNFAFFYHDESKNN